MRWPESVQSDTKLDRNTGESCSAPRPPFLPLSVSPAPAFASRILIRVRLLTIDRKQTPPPPLQESHWDIWASTWVRLASSPGWELWDDYQSKVKVKNAPSKSVENLIWINLNSIGCLVMANSAHRKMLKRSTPFSSFLLSSHLFVGMEWESRPPRLTPGKRRDDNKGFQTSWLQV